MTRIDDDDGLANCRSVSVLALKGMYCMVELSLCMKISATIG